jgi:hypothetical protein
VSDEEKYVVQRATCIGNGLPDRAITTDTANIKTPQK